MPDQAFVVVSLGESTSYADLPPLLLLIRLKAARELLNNEISRVIGKVTTPTTPMTLTTDSAHKLTVISKDKSSVVAVFGDVCFVDVVCGEGGSPFERALID